MPPRHRTWLAVSAVACAAVLGRALAFAGTELYADEAYYWLWSLRPAAGYYDHPPLVAWLIALSTRWMGGELGVRLLFLACGGLTVLFAALLAVELASVGAEGERERGAAEGVALPAALLTATAPLLSLVGGMALPDAPLAAAYTAGLWLLARARGRRWVWAGAAVGLALLAKYTAALLAPALLLALAWDPELRRELRTRWPWLGAGVAVLIFSPCLLWNAHHGWSSLRFQLGHGLGGAGRGAFLEFALGQIAAAGPVPLVLGAVTLVRGRAGAWRRVAFATLLPLAVTAAAALRGRVEANWPALVYPALCAAAAVGWARLRAGRWRWLALGASVGVGVLLVVAFGIEQRHPRWLAGTPAVERFHGGMAMAGAVRGAARMLCAREGCDADSIRVVTVNYQDASELAFYGGFRRFGPVLERRSQLDLWDERRASDATFLFIGPEALPAQAFPGCRLASAADSVRVAVRGAGMHPRAWVMAMGWCAEAGGERSFPR